MSSERIDQPSEQQPKLPAGGVQGAEGKFDLGMASVIPEGAMGAMKSYLASSTFGSSEKDVKGYGVTAKKGADDSTMVTLSQKGKDVAQFKVVSKTENYRTFFTVYQEPGGIKVSDLDTSHNEKIPDNLGELLKTKAGKKFYHALIVGFAMKIMNDLKKHQKMFSQAQKND